ncbi:hypothetical protein AAFF_G00400690 [Aldrovandia affinis]|uniref:Uncharacterized protein n=1 Tax=Aldrovandia affinis TaxID=143900 RepID=A0AAD7SCK2_9TELE|nr:hypothetical protein AAFF_G00400690 [Aldrovandia affinis]
MPAKCKRNALAPGLAGIVPINVAELDVSERGPRIHSIVTAAVLCHQLSHRGSTGPLMRVPEPSIKWPWQKSRVPRLKDYDTGNATDERYRPKDGQRTFDLNAPSQERSGLALCHLAFHEQKFPRSTSDPEEHLSCPSRPAPVLWGQGRHPDL